ncbi:MAG: alpha/beta hydrolase [Pseudomonadota bacterium]|nr:alpha/beta hydrolase [Pseudomonadota bacterium]
MSVRFDHLDRSELDRQLSPSLSAKDAGGVLARHAAETATLFDDPTLVAARDLAYSAKAACRMDIVRPAGDGPFPCLAFLHGGFWQEGSKAGSGFAARALAQAGWASALIGYTLAPAARLSEIVDEAGQAVSWLSDNAERLCLDPARLVLAGHSAGGHMAAAVVAGKAGAQAARVPTVAVLLSGVFDLAPIAASYVNDKVAMDDAEVEALSLLTAPPCAPIPVHIVVGQDEPPAFRDQSAALRDAWFSHAGDVTFREAPGRDHFDILDELADPASPTFTAILEMGR